MKKSSRHSHNGQEFILRQSSFVARFAAFWLNAPNMAIVFGKTVHLWNVTPERFLKNERWVKHELCHVRQFKEHGFFTFIFKYLFESIRHGYTKNKYELEARKAETA
ncbi:MAG: DUF4157 domain-containing protein [Chitinophagaceae bacterium]|nr:DUF4157 domain-containing protein [Chitinophagaceae bacterium]